MKISKESLLAWGMKEVPYPASVITPLTKIIFDDDEVTMSIDVVLERNQSELALRLHDGSVIFLNVSSIEELEAFVSCLGDLDVQYDDLPF